MSIIYKGLNSKHHYGLCILTINGELITANGEHFQAIQIDRPHGRIIDVDELSRRMYHEAFETDTDLQKWDEGCWIRYKMFENCRDLSITILEAEEI